MSCPETFQLLDIKKCIYLPNKREGCRFDVTVSHVNSLCSRALVLVVTVYLGGPPQTREKTYQFDCVEIQDAKDWVKAINRGECAQRLL